MADADHVDVELAGRTVRVTSPDKVMFPESGATKLDVVRYYESVAAPLMRTMGDRPVLMQRFPNGVGGSSFFQKRVPKDAPEWLETTIVATPNGTTSEALVAADVAHVVWAVNLGCLGFHVWPNTADDPEHADELRIDLDPQPGVDFEAVRAAASHTHALFEELGIEAWPKTTGNRGIHVYVRLTREWSPIKVRAAAVAIARELARRQPGSDHRCVVEGGARRARLHRLQPERAAQDRVRRVVGARPPGRAGVDAVRVGRARRRSTRTRSRSPTCPQRVADLGDPWAAVAERPQSLQPLLDMSERDLARASRTRRGHPSTRRCPASLRASLRAAPRSPRPRRPATKKPAAKKPAPKRRLLGEQE